MTTELDTQDEIYLFNTQKPIANLDGDTQQKGVREIVLGAKKEDEHQDLWLKLRDDDFTWNNLYLGRSKTFEKDSAPEHYNIIVPIIPRCYATPDRDAAAAVVPPSGWIYIIRRYESHEGTVVELWRELESDGLGNFRDVNLKPQKYKGMDQRKATGQWGFRVMVPYRIDQKDHELWIAYSEVQWSWARVQKLRGDEDLRNARMHKLDLSGCLNNFQKNDDKESSSTNSGQQDTLEVKNVSGPALLYNLNSAPDATSKGVDDVMKDDIPVVYLDNPVGIARYVSTEYKLQWENMKECMTDLRDMPDLVNRPHLYQAGSKKIEEDSKKQNSPEAWFEAAALANRYFYGDISDKMPPGIKNTIFYNERLTDIKLQFAEYRNKLDKKAIEQALRTSQRAQIRTDLVEARGRLLDYLNKELPTSSGDNTQDPPLVLALDDYFTLPPLTDRERKQSRIDFNTGNSGLRWRDHYADGWQAVFDITDGLSKFEYTLDSDLEADEPDGWSWRKENPAFEFMLNLADPEGGNPLHSRLFPKATASDPLKTEDENIEEENAVFKKQYLENLESVISRDPEAISGIAMFGSNFSDMMSMQDISDAGYEERLERAKHSLLRLVDCVFGFELESRETQLDNLIDWRIQTDQDNKLSIFDFFVKSMSLTKTTLNMLGDLSESQENGKNKLSGITTRVVRAGNKNNNRILNLLEKITDEKLLVSGISAFLGLLEIYNVSKAYKAFASNRNKELDWELLAPLIASLLKLPAAMNDVKNAISVVEKTAVEGVLTDTAVEVFRKRKASQVVIERTEQKQLSRFIKRLNLIGDAIEMYLSLKSLTENLTQHDDAAIADAITLTGAALGVASALFKVFPKAGPYATLIMIAGWAAKEFLFKEDKPIDIWVAKGPFALGDEYHEEFAYKREVGFLGGFDDQGKFDSLKDTATAYVYDNFKFIVDKKGTLINFKIEEPNIWQKFKTAFCYPRFEVEPNNEIYLVDKLKSHTYTRTLVATIGEKFNFHPLLQPKKKETKQKDVGKNELMWNHRQAYLALIDAVYRPRVSMTERSLQSGGSRITLNVNLPFFIPGKSRLFIDLTVKDDMNGKTGHPIKPNPDKINKLKVGPNDFEYTTDVPKERMMTFTAKVRLEPFEDVVQQLPFEPLFCGSDIETEESKKWIVVEKTFIGGMNVIPILVA